MCQSVQVTKRAKAKVQARRSTVKTFIKVRHSRQWSFGGACSAVGCRGVAARNMQHSGSTGSIGGGRDGAAWEACSTAAVIPLKTVAAAVLRTAGGAELSWHEQRRQSATVQQQLSGISPGDSLSGTLQHMH
jgi:hypothetical protein